MPSNYLVIDGMCNATGCIQLQQEICRIHLSICSACSDPCDLWLVDGISASHGLYLGNLLPEQSQLELQLPIEQLQKTEIAPMRAGLCLTKSGNLIAQGFPGGLHFPSIPFFHHASSVSLTPFTQHFGQPYHLNLSTISCQKLPIQGKCREVIAHDHGVQHCCQSYGGFYWNQMKDAILIGIPWTPAKDPLPLLSLLPVQAYLPPLLPNTFGCLLLGIHYEKDQFFPIIFR